MRRKHRRILIAIRSHPVPSGIRWEDAIALLAACGAEFKERAGSAIEVYLKNQTVVLHRPHPGNEIDKGAVASLRKFLERAGIEP